MNPHSIVIINPLSTTDILPQVLFLSLQAIYNSNNRLNSFSELEKDRIVEMAWEDRTTFDAIKVQFGINQGEVEKLMRKELKSSSFKRWRKRVSSGVGIKHEYKANPDMLRFKCSRQRSVSMNKISKR